MRTMQTHRRNVLLTVLGLVLAAAPGCEREHAHEAAHEAPTAVAQPEATNRIDVPPNVRRNLGITFAEVERRPVRRTLRLPGRFELRPGARHAYRALVPGRIELAVAQFEHVEAGQVLLRIDSPRWQELRHEVVEAEGEIKLAEAHLAVAEASAAEALQNQRFLEQRLERLATTGVRQIELEAERLGLEARLPRLEAEVRAKETELDEAREHYASILKVAASVTGLSVDELLQAVEVYDDEHGHERVRWRNLEALEIRAEADGVVQTLPRSSGGWAEAGELVMEVVDPRAIRFRADAPQSDLGRLRDGQAVRIAPSQGGSVNLQDAIAGTLRIGIEGHAGERTMPVYGLPETAAAWARPGVSAYLEVFVDGSDHPELAIPASSLVRDGLDTIFYRRDPADPDKVYPVEADLGASDGRWVVVYSGVTDGDEVVLDGAYALKMAGGQRQAPSGYHYHADGSLHKDH
ncbi:MAG: HlyD family efflux transporter periplasmic adaptor subunit [Phycisphaeraceae bacterium]